MAFSVPESIKQRLFREGKFVVSKVDSETIQQLEDWIFANRKEEDKKEEFTILINSPGGDPYLAIYFSSFLRMFQEDLSLTGIAFGECGSAALALLQCCHKRIGVKDCGFFIHHITNTFSKLNCQEASAEIKRIAHELERTRALEERLVELQCKRSGMTKRSWKRLADLGAEHPGSPIFVDEAKKYGLIDEIVDEYPIF